MESHPGLSSSLDKGEKLNDSSCNKDTGQRKQLRKWTRGHLFIVRGGGHIDMWQPLYQYVLYNGIFSLGANFHFLKYTINVYG